jgi:hypothetical protein
MRIALAVLASVCTELLMGCSRGQPLLPIDAAAYSASKAPGSNLYVSSYFGTSVYGFETPFKRGRPPACTVYTGRTHINDIAVDPSGNLIVPQLRERLVRVYAPSGNCVVPLGSFADPYGPPANAASLDATNGTIVLATLRGTSGGLGSLAVCSMAAGCTRKLKPQFAGYANGVAIARNGDCWLVTENHTFTAAGMTYWRGCKGTGQLSPGFKNVSSGSLSIDSNGNLASVDYKGGGTGQLWVYSGCNPACDVVGGPFKLQGQPFYGTLNARGDTFATLEAQFPYGGTIDVYNYAPSNVTLDYTFSSGFAPVSNPQGIAFAPAFAQ